VGSHPNGNDADPVLNSLSHEHRETIDDPYLGSGWFDLQNEEESSDKCAYYFGPTRSNGTGEYNQVINGHQYLLQAEWSNQLASDTGGLGCVVNGADHAPTAAFRFSANGAVAKFDGSLSTDPDPGDILDPANFTWFFGDIGRATGLSPIHRYLAASVYPVSLIVTDSYGASSVAGQTVAITAPPPAPTHAFQAALKEDLAPGFAFGAGTASQFGHVSENAAVLFDFTDFPHSLGVTTLAAFIVSDDMQDSLSVTYTETLTDTANPPAGFNYRVSGRFLVLTGTGKLLGYTGGGTIDGSCTSSFDRPDADCSVIWSGTVGAR
jgi:PKD repeat protein